jgi:signal transduction histidine kinase
VSAGPAESSQPRALDELYRVSQVVLSVTRQMSVRDVLQVIVRSARSLAGARYAALGVPDRRGSFGEFLVDGVSDSQWRAIGPLPRQHGMLGVLLREGKPERLDDIRADPRFEGWPSAHPELSGFLGVPVKDGDKVLAIIFVANADRGGGFTARDEELLSLFAAHAAIALTNARLAERDRELYVLQERSRLARDLHDAVSQKLFSLRARARAAAVLATRDQARAAAEMEAVAQLGAEAHAELRAVIDGLAPPDLGEAGLAESLRRYAVLAGRAHGVDVRFTAADLPVLAEHQDAALYRVAQEALHNALRHSGAAHIGVTLSRRPRRVVLEVADDGTGFVPDSLGARGGLGLASMRERAASAGGTLTVRSAPGAGTTIRLSVPLCHPAGAGERTGRTAGEPARAAAGEPARATPGEPAGEPVGPAAAKPAAATGEAAAATREAAGA